MKRTLGNFNVANDIFPLFLAPLSAECWFCLGSKNVEKHLKKKKEAEFGRAPIKTSLDIKNARFKSVGEVISE